MTERLGSGPGREQRVPGSQCVKRKRTFVATLGLAIVFVVLWQVCSGDGFRERLFHLGRADVVAGT